MKALIQRVMKASVSVGGECVSSIDQGLCVLIGISNSDTKKDMEYIARKILNLRLFDGPDGKRWHSNVMEKDLEILSVSQFTLYGFLKGNKPDFHNAMPGDKSKEFYNEFMDLLRKQYKPERIKDGVFAAYMQVSIQNDGPVTIEIESPSQDKNNSSNSFRKHQQQYGSYGPDPTSLRDRTELSHVDFDELVTHLCNYHLVDSRVLPGDFI